MGVSVERIDNNQVVLSFVATKDEVAKAHLEAYKKIVNKVKINGFRQGKAPRHIVELNIGKSAISEEAFDIFANKQYNEALKANDLYPVSDPEVTDIVFEEGKEGSFKIKTTVKPDAEVGEYKGVVVTKGSLDLPADALDKAIEDLQKTHSTMEPVSAEEAAGTKDVVMIDFAGFIDGIPFDGGSGKSYPLELGSNSFIPGFEDQLLGSKAGDERTVKVQFPADYGMEPLAGKEAEFKVVVHEVKRRQMPELNDDFAKSVDFDTMDSLKANTLEKLQTAHEEQIENKFREDVLKKVIESSSVDIPEVMISEKIDNMVAEFAMSMEQRGLKLEQYLEYTKQTVEQFKESKKLAATEQVKTELILDTICKLEKLELTNEEVGTEIVRLAQMHNATPKQVQEILKEQGTMGVLLANTLRRKAVNLIIESAKAE